MASTQYICSSNMQVHNFIIFCPLGKTLLPVRWIVAVLAFFGFIFNYMLRVNINLTIVSMVNYTQDENDTDNINECNRVKRLDYITFIFNYFTCSVLRSLKWLGKVKKDLGRQHGFDPITFIFSENSNYWRKNLLEVIR